MIQFLELNFSYEGKELYKGFNLTLAAGERLCLLGPSGGGKSTLLHLLMGFISPEEGSVAVDGVTLTSETVAAIRSQIAYVPQDVNLPFETVEELLTFPYTLAAKRGTHFERELAIQLLERLLLPEDCLGKLMRELSGGQKQRVLLAAALLSDCPLLLLDEPTAALDPATVALVGELLAASGRTVLAVSHDELFQASFNRTLWVEPQTEGEGQ